ncbi:MAG: DUF3617 family protein [Candidatus Krumholzibacteria bacterium]|jgi:hypothetical protein|nr:DUF3617 family protein [Candidatus Krumholzibacteria bacterium]
MNRIVAITTTILLVALLAGVAWTASPTVTGKWEVTTTTEMTGMPPQSVTHVQCMTDDNLVPVSEEARQECKITAIEIEGSAVSWSIICGEGRMTGTGRIIFEGDRMHGTMQMTIDGIGTQVTNTLTGRRIGDCDKPTPRPIAELIVGEWAMAPYGGVASGQIEFRGNGTHTTTEKHIDGVGVERKGGFRLDETSSPMRIQICTGECGAPGSEWTTLFGIVRFRSDDSMEIRFSPDDSYPSEFKTEDSKYTMMLKRKLR